MTVRLKTACECTRLLEVPDPPDAQSAEHLYLTIPVSPSIWDLPDVRHPRYVQRAFVYHGLDESGVRVYHEYRPMGSG